mgnify:FL=1
MYHLVYFCRSGDPIILEDIIDEIDVQQRISEIKIKPSFWNKNRYINVDMYEVYYSDGSFKNNMDKLKAEHLDTTFIMPHGDDVELISSTSKYFSNITKSFD